MEANEAINLGLIKKSHVGKVEVDPHRLAIDMFFGKTVNSKDYREEALDFLLDKRITFITDSNTSTTLFERIAKISCPKCLSECKMTSASGTSDSMTMNYRCPECDTEIGIPILNNLYVKLS